ncbi:uncharacterized protein [Argopecten irradians]|uniref:uncharacterized protein n=1 Tax=Argopecten irradians TaxID=31199 RepID=UPI00371F1D62
MRKDGSSQVRRQLDFREKILTKRTFYIDVREEELRKRIIRRVKDLGGQVEDFLSKDVNILLTDSNSTAQKACPLTPNASPDPDKKVAVPLSRGKALLLKATKQSSCQQSNKGPDIIQNALNLGVKVEKAKDFLKSTHKHAQKLKQVRALHSDGIDGITPIQWKNSDKENFIILKVEDDKQAFRPFLKHFKDSFPKIRYNDDLASPFDKGVTLCRTVENKTKNRYSTKGKPSVASGKGGFCEACDYWYRCTLREHLGSMKHQKFVQTHTNFKQLDQIINKMPNIQDFMSKFNLDNVRCTEEKQTDILSEQLDTNCSIEGIKDFKPVAATCDIPMEMSASPAPVVNNDRESVLSNFAMVVSPVPAEPVNSHCETDMTMEVDISMPKNPFDECSRDSGTGPEIQEDISIPCDFVKSIHSFNRDSEQIVDEDSAFQHDQTSNDTVVYGHEHNTGSSIIPNSTQSVNSIFTPSIDSENAMFLDLNVEKDNPPVQEITSNVRKKLSAILITDSNGSQSKKILASRTHEKKNEENKTPEACSFAGLDNLSSPVCHKSINSPRSAIRGRKLDFANIAADWMKDISQSQMQQNQETPTTSTKKKMSTKKSKRHSSMSKRKKKSKRSAANKENDWPFSLFNSRSCDSSESDLELPQLPVLNSNVAKQRLIEEERKLQSSPIQFCSRQVLDQRATSTCTKRRVKLFSQQNNKSIGFKRLSNSPSFSNTERLCNKQTKMPQYFPDKSSCDSPMVLSPPQLPHFSSLQIQQNTCHLPCPILSPTQAASTSICVTNTLCGSQSSQNPSSQTLPYIQSLESDCAPGTPTNFPSNSKNFATPTNMDFDDSRTEEYYDVSTPKAFVPQIELDNSPPPKTKDREFETLLKSDNLPDYGSDTEPYVSFSPVCTINNQQQLASDPPSFLPLSSDYGCNSKTFNNIDSTNRNSSVRSYASDRSQIQIPTVSTNLAQSNHFTITTRESCSGLSFSVESILSGRTGKNPSKTGEPKTAASSSIQDCESTNIVRPIPEPTIFPPKTTEKKKRKRKRHESKKDRDPGCQYYVCPQEGTKIKLCRVMVTPMEQKNNLKTFWKVTKAGSCRLVFSAEKGKGISNVDMIKKDTCTSVEQVQSSKRRKLVY